MPNIKFKKKSKIPKKITLGAKSFCWFSKKLANNFWNIQTFSIFWKSVFVIFPWKFSQLGYYLTTKKRNGAYMTEWLVGWLLHPEIGNLNVKTKVYPTNFNMFTLWLVKLGRDIVLSCQETFKLWFPAWYINNVLAPRKIKKSS